MDRFIFFLAFIFGLTISVQGQESELRSLESFTKIKVATGIDATIVEGLINQIEITGDGIELDEIISSVNGDQLVVRLKTNNTVSSENMELNASSGANLDIEILCGDIEAIVSTGAEMKLKGEARRLDLRFNTGASFSGFNLLTQKVKVKGGTGANAEINVAEYLKTNINTGATLDYKGNPAKKDINKGTGGEVKHRE